MTQKIMICKFCGNKEKLIKAHIIPAGFFRRLRRGEKALELITNIEGEYKKRSHVGVYDRTIVCSKCENIWQEWDRYAQRVLVENLSIKGTIRIKNKTVSYTYINSFNYDKLKLFFISVIWRASVSSHNYFKGISLGKLEDVAKQMIAQADSGDSESFSVVLSRFDYPIAGILDPHLYKDKKSRIQYCRLYLGSYIADIKIDYNPTPEPYSNVMMKKNKPLCIIYRNLAETKEFDLIKKLLGIPSL